MAESYTNPTLKEQLAVVEQLSGSPDSIPRQERDPDAIGWHDVSNRPSHENVQRNTILLGLPASIFLEPRQHIVGDTLVAEAKIADQAHPKRIVLAAGSEDFDQIRQELSANYPAGEYRMGITLGEDVTALRVGFLNGGQLYPLSEDSVTVVDWYYDEFFSDADGNPGIPSITSDPAGSTS